MHRRDALLLLGATLAVPARAETRRPVLVELFTSQGCSTCPPAEALLADLVRTRPDVLALAWHVTYWDSLGWRDTFAFEAATERQRRYARLLPAEVYTPQMVIEGTSDIAGFARDQVLATIAAARPAGPALTAKAADGTAEITIGPSQAGGAEAEVLLVGYDAEHQTDVKRGENAGRHLQQLNIVRGLASAGRWTGAALRLQAPVPAGERHAVLLQDVRGRILAVARITG